MRPVDAEKLLTGSMAKTLKRANYPKLSMPSKIHVEIQISNFSNKEIDPLK
jgi:hypothetical protein